MSRYAQLHANPSGPGDARPTALQIIQDENLLAGKLTGKIALVTGANVSIGLESARALHAAGMTVYLGARDPVKGEAARLDILASSASSSTPSSAPVHVLQMELDSLASVRRAANEFLSKEPTLTIFIANAGVMATPEGRTRDGFETQFGTNHLGHFLLFHLLKDRLLAGSSPEFHSRFVSVSSMGHRGSEIRFHDGVDGGPDYAFDAPGSYNPWTAYGQAKTANIYLANEIERRYGSGSSNPRLHALSLHPGGIWSNLQQHVGADVIESWKAAEGLNDFMKSPAQGASTSIYAAVSAEWEGRGGRYLDNCLETGPVREGLAPLDFSDNGYAPWAFDVQKATKLWEESCRLVGVQDD
ncbi:unnamed protein product [Parascedosporium putredinis]|uniref:WW domain-containing oxidoreductase n=1 Tax=Parascedosporium putredinis TaxID=1442378 RepID=A0A9P1H0A1_9PEZI|nr:unnamed protein product [Parascedosporium putredinis]CAI7993684.1 unnamed protein product [Parascedosporium putredinis]